MNGGFLLDDGLHQRSDTLLPSLGEFGDNLQVNHSTRSARKMGWRKRKLLGYERILVRAGCSLAIQQGTRVADPNGMDNTANDSAPLV